jgi:hypothetical protein
MFVGSLNELIYSVILSLTAVATQSSFLLWQASVVRAMGGFCSRRRDQEENEVACRDQEENEVASDQGKNEVARCEQEENEVVGTPAPMCGRYHECVSVIRTLCDSPNGVQLSRGLP